MYIEQKFEEIWDSDKNVSLISTIQLIILCLMTEVYLFKLANVKQFGSHCRTVVILKLS